jgi:hypothetical protein
MWGLSRRATPVSVGRHARPPDTRLTAPRAPTKLSDLVEWI